MRAAVATDLDRIAELIQTAKAAVSAEDWHLTIVSLRNASYDCLLVSNSLIHTESSPRVVDLSEEGLAASWSWH